MAEKKRILYIVEAMGGDVFTYIVDLANELVNKYDMYIAYAVRKQTPKNYKDYFDKRIHLIEVKNFGRAINLTKDIAAFFEVKKIAAEVKPDVIHNGENSFVCSDTEEFVKSIKEARNGADGFTEWAYQDVLNMYNTKAMAKQYSEKYDKAINTPGGQHELILYVLTNDYATAKAVA